MTTVDWAAICDLAFVDRFGRLHLLGLDAGAPVRTLQAGIHRLSIVIHLQDRVVGDESNVALYVTPPDGQWWVADGLRDFCVESHGGYLLIHIPKVPLQDEGIYRFDVAGGTSRPALCQLSVLVCSPCPKRVQVHGPY